MKTIYFKTIVQKSTETHSTLIAVIPNEMLGDLPEICEFEAFMMPKTIYTGTYPQIKINTDTMQEREDLKGLGIAGILTKREWATKVKEENDLLGIEI